MAFSQKHDGKVYVPWYNTNEWRSVYNLLTSNCPENLRKALSILKIWKNITPLLSAGVEGTLILLETILADFNNTPEPQVIQIYSITLLRFLNISAANSNRQGNFNRTVSKNDLPKWLIDIRHDIAHDHILPSKSMLELALTNSLQWLIEKYWKIQNHSISDYVVNTDYSNAKIFDCLNAYVRLNLNMYRGFDLNEYDEALMEKVNYLVSKRYNKLKTDTQGLIIILEEILKQALSDPDNRKIANKVAKKLVDEKALLGANLETTKEGNEVISKTFKKLWKNLLNILYENEGFLAALFDQLWLFIICNSKIEIDKKIACLWICDLLNGLLKEQALQKELTNQIEQNPSQADLMTTRLNLKYKLEKKFPEYQDCTEFESLEKLCLVNLDNFEKNILQNPNIFAVKFLDRVMKFNKNPEDYRCLITHTFANMYERIGRTSKIGFSNISTIDNLPFNLGTYETDIPSRIDRNCFENTKDAVMKEDVLHCKRLIKIKNTLPYKNCPFGQLPHQSKTENPLLMNRN
ncbi:unnamed protein product [Psylliodes chrysocephalus]|uniref:Las1-like protein n=1 Tax=Psylliodes chrysocephalus TaxID=3402493 RepID=A0A9P0GEZ2_9CUCU|nr:unnamed protein product [Psylliodes chrysocephala]